MNRSQAINPLIYRYLPRDKELTAKLQEYPEIDDIYFLRRFLSEMATPRLNALETQLLKIAKEYQGKEIPRRIDGRIEGTTTVDTVYRGYAERLGRRLRLLQGMSVSSGEEAKRNDTLSDLCYLSVATLSVEANIANDIRHLFRSEIEEVTIPWDEERVGSSTMPHKMNPADFENIVSLWKAYLPRVSSAILAQITEHQGDTTNEFLLPMTLEILVALSYATKALTGYVENLKINV